MADLPELPESSKRKLALQWSTLLDTHRLTGAHLYWHDKERDRLRRIAAQAGDTGRGSRGGGGSWRDENAADGTGIAPSVAVAEGRFKDLSGEYLRIWFSSAAGYEGFVGWLDILRQQVSTEVATVWAGGSKAIARWYKRACGPAIEKALTALVKEGTGCARSAELKRLERGAKAKGESQKTTELHGVPSIIGKLPKDALVRMEAATAAFMAEYLPKLEREASKRGPVHDAELLRELVIHQFNLVARECMAVCASAEEFEAELYSDIARFVRFGLSKYQWLADPMLQELDTGFTFFVVRANPWARIPEAERATAWHVGAITGEALSHVALKLRAEAWARAAEGGFGRAQGPASTGVPTAETAVAGKGGNGAGPIPQFPNRALWLKDRLQERSWNKHDLSRQGGPDCKTVQKILNGRQIREDVLEKLATALSKAPASKKLPNVTVLDIPQD